MSRVALFCLTLSGVATSLVTQAGGVSIETYKGLYQVGGILYYNPPTEEGTPGQMTATTQYQGGGDPFSDPSGGVDPSPFEDPSMYLVPGSGSDDPHFRMDPFVVGSDPYLDPTMVGGSDPYSDPFGGSDPEFNGTAGRVRLRLPYTAY